MRGGGNTPLDKDETMWVIAFPALPNKVTSNHSYFWGLIVANESRYPWYAACMPVAHQLWFPLIPPIQSSLFHAPLEPSCYKIKLFADKIMSCLTVQIWEDWYHYCHYCAIFLEIIIALSQIQGGAPPDCHWCPGHPKVKSSPDNKQTVAAANLAGEPILTQTRYNVPNHDKMQDHCYARPQYNHREVWYQIHRVSLEAPGFLLH